MNKILEEIYTTWNKVESEENISYQTVKIADDTLINLDYYPSYIWHTLGNVILEYIDKNKKLFFIINEKEITGKLCIDGRVQLEYMYLTSDNINTILNNFWE